jgi:anti-sigma factor RsiW
MISGISGPPCREIRQLLGVYVVGAIDPAERTMVDEHLGQCPSCRDELAGLAGLPAMLSRVPAADVEQLSLAPSGLPEMVEPSADLLNSMLRQVSVKRRSRLWRGAVAVAASATIAAGGATAIAQLTGGPAAQVAASDIATGADPATGAAAVVQYSATPWHTTAMRVQVSGIKPGTTCQFWIVGKDGRAYAGSWTVSASYRLKPWYTVSSPVPESTVHSFQITSAGKVLVNIPAT